VLEELLERRIRENHGSGVMALGGPREAADIINAAVKAVEKRVMPEIARIDRNLARRIEAEMFKFEHLFVLDDRSMGSLLREVESDTLISALKGTAPENRELFLRAMSSRAAQGVKDEIEARGRMKMAEVVEAQKAIVAAARRLAAEGVIAFGSGEDDYV
jgi:flagellar motor switch protein FliG